MVWVWFLIVINFLLKCKSYGAGMMTCVEWLEYSVVNLNTSS